MEKTETELLSINDEKLNYKDDLYEKPVYQSTLHLPIRPPTRRLTGMFKSKTYNRIMSTVCFVLFIIGFFWSMFKNGEVDIQKIQKYADLLFFETGANQDVNECPVKKSTGFWSIYKIQQHAPL